MSHGKRARALAILVTLCLVGMASPAVADTPARKLGRSLSNITLGVLAVPGQIAETSREHGPFVGATWGLAKGVGYMAATEVVGLFELCTAPFETPPDFKPIMKPEFPWQYFTEEGRRALRAGPKPPPRSRRTR